MRTADRNLVSLFISIAPNGQIRLYFKAEAWKTEFQHLFPLFSAEKAEFIVFL